MPFCRKPFRPTPNPQPSAEQILSFGFVPMQGEAFSDLAESNRRKPAAKIITACRPTIYTV